MSIDSSPFTGRELALRLRPAEERITDLTLRFLIDAERGPLPGVEALDVHPSVLLHPSVPSRMASACTSCSPATSRLHA